MVSAADLLPTHFDSSLNVKSIKNYKTTRKTIDTSKNKDFFIYHLFKKTIPAAAAAPWMFHYIYTYRYSTLYIYTLYFTMTHLKWLILGPTRLRWSYYVTLHFLSCLMCLLCNFWSVAALKHNSSVTQTTKTVKNLSSESQIKNVQSRIRFSEATETMNPWSEQTVAPLVLMVPAAAGPGPAPQLRAPQLQADLEPGRKRVWGPDSHNDIILSLCSQTHRRILGK